MDRNIILLFGGESDERLVSVASAQALAHALDKVTLWFWDKSGNVFDIKYDELVNHKNSFIAEFVPNNNALFNNITEAIASKLSENHVFLLGVHGGFGENGSLQALLEKYQRAYTGSNAHASRLAFNKIATKECLRSLKINMAPHIVVENNENIATVLQNFFAAHGEIIVKPVCGGSSVGCVFMRNSDDLHSVIQHIATHATEIFFAEKVIRGREITIGVIDTNDGLKALPGTEIVLEKNRDFDYEGKYLGLGTKEITPPTYASDVVKAAQDLAILAHQTLGLEGYSRADLIIADDGLYFLETNTLPGLTKQSLVPQQLCEAGITMAEFLRSQIDFAIRRSKQCLEK